MKLCKKLISVFMIVTVLLSCIIPAVSAANEAESKNDNEYVACMYVCQKARKAYLSGHTWLYFKNLTDHSITVGAYTLPANQGVSVGTYGYSIKDGKGVYYNVEGYRYTEPTLTDFVCLSKNLTQSQLDAVSQKIKRSGYWSYLLNCSFFAFTTWDVVPGQLLIYLILPLLARLSIILYPSHTSGFELYDPKPDQIFKQKGFGDNAVLVPADPTVP
jgi:hypothetical protein